MRPPSGAGAGAAAGRCRLPSAAAQRDAALQKARARARRSGAARTAPSAWRCRRRGGCCAAARRRSHARSTSRPRCCRCSRRGCATASHTPCVPLRHLPHRACQVRGVSRGSAACTCALAVRPLLNLVSCPGNARSTKCRPLRQRLLTASRRQAMVAGACKLRAHAAEGALCGPRCWPHWHAFQNSSKPSRSSGHRPQRGHMGGVRAAAGGRGGRAAAAARGLPVGHAFTRPAGAAAALARAARPVRGRVQGMPLGYRGNDAAHAYALGLEVSACTGGVCSSPEKTQRMHELEPLASLAGAQHAQPRRKSAAAGT